MACVTRDSYPITNRSLTHRRRAVVCWHSSLQPQLAVALVGIDVPSLVAPRHHMLTVSRGQAPQPICPREVTS
jgi:hypothetical protein